MKRAIGTLVVLLILVSCGGRPSAPPRNLDNACSIVSQKPAWLTDMKATERKWGIPVHVQMATIHQESKFVADARTPRRFALGVIPMGRQSSAFGFSQALDGTWDEYQAEQRRYRARRDRFEDAVDFMGWYMHKSYTELGISKSDTRNQYLAYHDGRTGYRRGSYRSKPWLIRVAGEVASRGDIYRKQLIGCGKI